MEMIELSVTPTGILSGGRCFEATGKSGVPKIMFVSAPCGSGKTYGAAQFIAEKIKNSLWNIAPNFVYVGPSIRLLKEVAALLVENGILNFRIFSSEAEPGRVRRELVEYFRSFDGTGQVVLCAHSAFLNLPYFHKREQWYLIIDEIPQVDYYFSFSLPLSGKIISMLLEAKPCNENISTVKPRSRSELEKHVSVDDDVTDQFKHLFRILLTQNYDVYTHSESFDRVVNGRSAACGKSDGKVHFLALLKPKALDGTIVMGSNFEQSMLFDLVKRNGCLCEPHEGITGRLRYSTYPQSIGSRTTIRYCLEGRRYSKWMRDQTDSNGSTLKEAIDIAIVEHVGEERFLLYLNKDDRGLLRNAKSAILLPGSPGGLNCYSDHTRLVFMAALNRSPMHLRMLGWLGFRHEIIRQSTLVEQVHQSVLRTSLRLPDATEPVEIIVPDKSTARAISSILVERL